MINLDSITGKRHFEESRDSRNRLIFYEVSKRGRVRVEDAETLRKLYEAHISRSLAPKMDALRRIQPRPTPRKKYTPMQAMMLIAATYGLQ